MVIVCQNEIFYNKNDVPHRGFYMDDTLKPNVDNYFIAAVKNKWDCILLITGIEGSGKSTFAFGLAHYMDPSFPGEPLNDGTPRRKCTRIVFTFKQLDEAIDKANPGEAIVFDEAVTAMMSQDASGEIQKILIKKMTMIRKKRLYILLLIPNIFMLRRYFAVSRTRALIHFYTPDGISRGFFKFYNYEDKRQLYFKGFKMWDQNAHPKSFHGRSTDTSWYFFDDNEYQKKKDEGIAELTAAPAKAKKEESARARGIREIRDKAIFYLYCVAEKMRGPQEKKFTFEEFRIWLKNNVNIAMELNNIRVAYNSGRKLIVNNATIGNQEESETEFLDK